MFLKQIDLTTALRPDRLPDEDILFVQDNVGLYEGKFKLQNQQDGQIYLTTHRICYVDKTEPRKHSLCLDLKDVESYEFYGGFLKSSPKVTLTPKPSKRSSLQARSPAITSSPSKLTPSSPLSRQNGPFRVPEPSRPSTTTWVCTICTFPNTLPPSFDPATTNEHTPLPPCNTCGIKPTLAHLLKATISSASGRPAVGAPLPVPASPQIPEEPHPGTRVLEPTPTPAVDPEASFQCPRCTFLNHPSLLSCEICGASLISRDLPTELETHTRKDSPGPSINTSFGNVPGVESPENVKISFRGGGEKIFYERFKGSMKQRKWLLHGAPPIPKRSDSVSSSDPGSATRVKTVGIAGLEKRGMDMRKNNELQIGGAFEDLDTLMASAKEIVALAERFARQTNGGGSSEANALLAESMGQLGLVTTKDMVGGSGGDESLYLSELARNLAEFLTDDARGMLRKAGGIISLVDLWAMFNRARGGVELVSPTDFHKAAKLWEKLRLPVRLRTFKSGVMVVQGADRTDEATIKTLLSWLRDFREIPPDDEVGWDWRLYGRGVTAQAVAERFGWSMGVAEEELEMAEERGALCRDEGVEGVVFWENHIDDEETRERLSKQSARKAKEEEEKLVMALRQNGLL